MELHEIKTMLEEQGTLFEDFATRHRAEVSKLKNDLDAERKERETLELRLNRPGAQPGAAGGRQLEAERKALGAFARTGSEAELKALSVGSDPDGGYLVTPALSDRINQKVWDVSPLARLARRVVIPSGDAFEEPVDPSDITASWVGENQARTAETTPTLKYMRVPLCEITTTQTITQKLLDLSAFDVGAWVDGKIADKFARSEGDAFINGDGVLRPRGLLTYDVATTTDATRDWFTIQYLYTGQSAGFATSNPGDKLVDLVYSLRAPYRANARWLMNSSTAGIARKFKEATTNAYLWQPGLSEGQPPSLLGYPIEIDEQMPDIGADTYSARY